MHAFTALHNVRQSSHSSLQSVLESLTPLQTASHDHRWYHYNSTVMCLSGPHSHWKAAYSWKQSRLNSSADCLGKVARNSNQNFRERGYLWSELVQLPEKGIKEVVKPLCMICVHVASQLNMAPSGLATWVHAQKLKVCSWVMHAELYRPRAEWISQQVYSEYRMHQNRLCCTHTWIGGKHLHTSSERRGQKESCMSSPATCPVTCRGWGAQRLNEERKGWWMWDFVCGI